MTLAKGLAHHLKACWFADKLPISTGRQQIGDQLLLAPKLLLGCLLGCILGSYIILHSAG